jgi:hypothetical protein
MPEPQLPPFDPSRIQRIPDEDEMRTFIAEVKRVQDQATEEDEGATQDGMLALTPEIEPANAAEAATPIPQNGRRPWWIFWSVNSQA